MSMSSPALRRPSSRINLRLAGLIGAVVLVAGYFGFTLLADAFSGGVRDKGDYLAVDLQKMVTSFTFDDQRGTAADIPQKWRDISGRTVEMTGEIVQSNSSSPYVSEFTLVYSIAKCCNGTAPQVQHFIRCRAPSGGRLPYFDGLVRVRGKLFVDIRRDNETGRVYQVFRLDALSTEPA